MEKIRVRNGIYLISDFLNSQECDDLIIFSENKGYEPAKVTTNKGQVRMEHVRNNDRLIIHDFQLAERYWRRLQTVFKEPFGNWQPIGLNEQFRFYKYAKGQVFRQHRDGNYRRSAREMSWYTFMIYLNEDYEGGATHFGELKIEPKKGYALCFEHHLLHEGTEVTGGIKYALRSDVMYRHFNKQK